MWIGAILGVLLSVVIGSVFIVLFYVANTAIFSGNAQLIFKGSIAWVAALLITIVAFHMLKFYNLERKWKRKLEIAVETREVRRGEGEGGGAGGRGRGAAPAAVGSGAGGRSRMARRGGRKGSHCSTPTASPPPAPCPASRLTPSGPPPHPLTLPPPQATAKSYRWSILLLAGSSTLREGLESVLFLTGVSAGEGIQSVIIPGIIGIVLGAALGIAIFYT